MEIGELNVFVLVVCDQLKKQTQKTIDQNFVPSNEEAKEIKILLGLCTDGLEDLIQKKIKKQKKIGLVKKRSMNFIKFINKKYKVDINFIIPCKRYN